MNLTSDIKDTRSEKRFYFYKDYDRLFSTSYLNALTVPDGKILDLTTLNNIAMLSHKEYKFM